MCPKKNWLFRPLLAAIAVLAASIGLSSPSEAYVYQVVVDSVITANYFPVPVGSSTPSTTAVNYTVYTGRIFGALEPNNPLNSVITDINLASPIPGYTPPSGTAGYISNFQIITPTDPAARSGLLIYWVVNRGGTQFSVNAMAQGATYVESGWQGDLLTQCSGTPTTLPVTPYPCVSLSNPAPGFGAGAGGFGTPTTTFPFFNAPTGLSRFVTQVPVATTDGNPPNPGNTLSGPVYGQINKGTTGTTGQLIMYESYYVPYWPASFDTAQATFWSDAQQTTQGQDFGQTPVPGNAWEWAYCPNGPNGAGFVANDPYWICLLSGATFNPNQVYEMVYNAVNPLVQGVGYASTRDLISFLRYGTSAPGGGSNPVAGTVTKTMITGQSQSGGFTRGVIFNGFNEDEGGRIVFDGAYPDRDGRMLWLNERFEQANVLASIFMAGQEAPVWWADYPNQARGLPADGIFHRCTTSGTCPQVMETFDSNTFYGEKMGTDFVGYCFPCTADIPLPPNDGSNNHVYRYFLPGTKHGGGSGGFTWNAPGTLAPCSGCLYPTDPVSEQQTFNALNSDFYQLLLNGTPMPPSFGGPGGTYPTLASGELAPATNQAAVGFPNNVPGFPYGGNQAWPSFVYNFGPDVNYDQESGVPTIQPPQIQQVFTPYVPTVNSDGLENVGSVPDVLFQAPLGTYIGWNIYASYSNHPCTIPPGGTACGYAGQQAQLSGSYWPFWDTKANRTTAGDPRPSLEERYGTHLGYDCVVNVAANKNVEKRFLLASDAATLMGQAAASTTILPAPFVPTIADTSLVNTLCFRTDSHDFNGAGMSDILWHDTSGDVAMWLMNAGAVSSSAGVGNATTNWSIVGQRDFNGDGNADILWHDSSGDVAIWFMNGSSVTQSAGVGNANPAVWSIAGTGDFNGDGKGDILWRDTSGNVAIWEMNGSTVLQSCGVGNAPTTWSIVGTGDFNGDDHSDILWRDTSGNVSVWFMNGCSVTQSSGIGNAPSTWSVAGTGDFNGDGKSDILWHDSSGDVAVWLMNGASVLQSAGVGNAATVWSVAATGDFNGDGYSDILWQDTTGDVALWEMTGAQVIKSSGVGTAPSVWTVQGLGAD